MTTTAKSTISNLLIKVVSMKFLVTGGITLVKITLRESNNFGRPFVILSQFQEETGSKEKKPGGECN